MTQPLEFSGGQTVKASTLRSGDFVRDPRKADRILVVQETGSIVFARGYSADDAKYHHYFSLNDDAVKITNPTTENVVPAKEGTGQE